MLEYYDNCKYPRVTSVIASAGLIDTEWFTDEVRDRGSAVHLACQFLDENDLDWSTVDPKYLPYVKAYEKFLNECKPMWKHIEHRITDDLYGYTGTVDRIGMLFDKNCVLDIKSGGMYPATGIQLAAYEAATKEKLVRYGLQVKDDESYKLKKYEDRTDIKIFRSALAVAKWKEVNL